MPSNLPEKTAAPLPESSVPLAPRNRTLSFERRNRLWLTFWIAASLIPTFFLLRQYLDSLPEVLSLLALLALVYLLLADIFLNQLIRPLQTLSNIVSAIREEDYSFRARGARPGDTVGDLALEINALSGALQTQRIAAQDAQALLQRVLTSMHSPVLAFDDEGHLRLLNAAAHLTFRLGPEDPVGRHASELHLEDLFAVPDQGLYPAAAEADALTQAPTRFSMRRTTFRLHGRPHTLLVLSDVAAVLREEERLAWQRLIRVLSHEINNSLTPIHSIAGSLRSRSSALTPDDEEDFKRGLSIIEDRAASLNRFLQAYQRLTHLPAPNRRLVSVNDLANRTASLETRLPITIIPGPQLTLLCDPDQLQQALINLLQNAIDAALTASQEPEVLLTWASSASELCLRIEDNGLGIDNLSNLFVPFYTTKPQGSGIGLVLAQQIAAAHGGSITLRPNANHRGTTAVFTLPLTASLTETIT